MAVRFVISSALLSQPLLDHGPAEPLPEFFRRHAPTKTDPRACLRGSLLSDYGLLPQLDHSATLHLRRHARYQRRDVCFLRAGVEDLGRDAQPPWRPARRHAEQLAAFFGDRDGLAHGEVRETNPGVVVAYVDLRAEEGCAERRHGAAEAPRTNREGGHVSFSRSALTIALSFLLAATRRAQCAGVALHSKSCSAAACATWTAPVAFLRE